MIEFAQAIDTNTMEDEVVIPGAVDHARERLRSFLVEEVCAERKSAETGRGVDIRWLMFEELMENLRAAAVDRERAIQAGTTIPYQSEEDRREIRRRLAAEATRREEMHADLRKGTRTCESECTCSRKFSKDGE